MAIQIAIVFVVGWAAFMAAGAIARSLVTDPPLHQLLLKVLLAALSLGLIAVWRSRVAGTYGLTKALGVPWARVLLKGAAMGAVASLVILLAGGQGMQAVFKSFKFWQIVLFVWLGSSIAEEIFTRGWAQGALERWSETKFGGISVPVLAGAVLFSSLHLSLFTRGVDPITATIVVCSTLLLGIVAGRLREQFKGLAPAIGVHVGFNVGGVLGGIVYAIVYRIATGRLPFAA